MSFGRLYNGSSSFSWEKYQTSYFNLQGSFNHTPSILSSWILFFLLLLLTIPWKNFEFSSSSTSHFNLDFYLTSNMRIDSISSIRLFQSHLEALSREDKGLFSETSSISSMFLSNNWYSSLSILLRTFFHFLISFLKALSFWASRLS